MSAYIRDLRRLASLIEAECDGQEIDRDAARRLAQELGSRHPHIRGTMKRISERMDRAAAAR